MKKIIVILTLAFSSCAKPYAMWQVMVGNYRYEQGRHQEATSYYFDALLQEYQEDIIYFNLGSLYHAQGEVDAAQKMWILIDEHSTDILQSQAHYNRGVTHYQLGEYLLAIQEFRKALMLNSHDINAKINMELSQNAYKRQQEYNSQDSQPIPETSQRQLDYLKRRNTIYLNIEMQDTTWLNPDDL